MANKVMILVHGMGTHAKGDMKKEYKKALTDRAKDFGIDITNPLKKMDIVEFNYSEYFDAIRLQFAQNAQARAKGFGYLTGQGFEENLITQLTNFETKLGKDSFFYTHWLDVVLYGTMYFGEKVRLDFVELFEKTRAKYGHENMHIVSYSLGTAVMHDALAKFYRTESVPYDDIPDLPVGSFNVASIWTFANVSRLLNMLNGLTDPYSSTVVTGNKGCASNFRNVRNKYDPFTWFRRYDRSMKNCMSFTSSSVREADMHDFYEYVTEPKVARSILFEFYGVKVTDAQYEAGRKAYRKTALKAEAKELRERIKDLAEDPSIDSADSAIESFKSVYTVIDRIGAGLQP